MASAALMRLTKAQSQAKATTSSTMANTSAWDGSMIPVTSGRFCVRRHERVDVPVDVHVDGVGAARGQRSHR